MPENTFTAIDFETAQGYRWSICQVGLVRVERGSVTQELSLLVRPPDNYYWDRFTDIHGLSWEDTTHSPDFAQVWPQLVSLIEGQTVVAHNAAFDCACLRQALKYYGQKEPVYERRCTYQIYRKALNVLCAEMGICLNHHDALSDARACAELYLRWLQTKSR